MSATNGNGSIISGRVNWKPVIDFINTHDSFHIITHDNPDGDAIGSQLGLMRFLKSIGKRAIATGCGAAPEKYRFLHHDELGTCSRRLMDDVQGLFMLDAGEWVRLGCDDCSLRSYDVTKIYIDHHPMNGTVDADLLVVDPYFSSTSEMIYELICAAGGEVTEEIAEALYVGIVTDTGHFMFGNSSPHAHRTTAALIETGIDVRLISSEIYQQSSLERLRLIGESLKRMKVSDDGAIAWTVVPLDDIKKHGVRREEMEGFIDVMRMLKKAEIFFIIWQIEDRKVKASLRSRGRVVVNGIAENLGGGGHQYAAGFTIAGDIHAVESSLLEECARTLSRDPR